MNELVILIIGFVTAFLVSVITVKWLLKFVKKHTFKAFGIYRILLGVIVLLYFSFK
jgi:undecaprenyl-diphosphatase